MRLLPYVLLALGFTVAVAVADTKITDLPLGSAAGSGSQSVVPYVDTAVNVTKKLKLSDFANIPALSTPQFCTAKPLTGFISSSGAVTSTDTVLTAIEKLNGNSTPGAPVSMGTFDSQAPTATGASITSNVLYNQSADATHPGMVNTTTQTIAGNKTGTGTWTVGQFIDNGTTASTVPYLDASKQLTSSAVTPTELGYVSGVTSALQTQLNGKQASGSYITALTGDGTASGPGSSALTFATVNSNVGSFTYGGFTVNAKGLITAASSGTAPVTSLTVASANGFAGSFSASTTPALTLTTSVTGILKGNGTAISAATSGTDYAPATSGSLPLFGSGAGGFTNGSVTGNTTKVATSTGSLTTDNCAKWDANGNIVDAGAACGAGAGTVTTTGSPASGNLTKFSGASSITSGDLSGDITTSGTLAATLATVNSNVGSFGSSTAIPSFTVNGKGLVTAASTNAVIAPAGTLTGTTLASGVVTSSLTSVGTIATGVWNGTRLTSSYVPTDVAYTDVTNSWSANQNFALNALTFAVPNAGVTGTTNGKLAKLNSSGAAIITTAGDTGAVGVVVSGGGTTSNANIMFGGATACVSDNTTVVGHYAQISASVAGDCTDSGTALGSALPTTGGQVVGVWGSAGAAGAQTLLPLSPAFGVASGGGGGSGLSRFVLSGATVPYVAIDGAHYQTATQSLTAVNISMLNSGTSGSTVVQVNQYRSGALQASATASLSASSGNPAGGSQSLSGTLSLASGDVVTVDVNSIAGGAPSELSVEF